MNTKAREARPAHAVGDVFAKMTPEDRYGAYLRWLEANSTPVPFPVPSGPTSGSKDGE